MHHALYGKERLPGIPALVRLGSEPPRQVHFIVDTGSEDTFLSEAFFATLRAPPYPKRSKHILGIGGKTKVVGYAGGIITLQGSNHWLRFDVDWIWQVLDRPMNLNILGREFFRRHKGTLHVDYVRDTIMMQFDDVTHAIPKSPVQSKLGEPPV